MPSIDGVEPGGGHPFDQPMARDGVFGREGRAVDAGLESADLSQFVEVAQKALRIDGRHRIPRG